MASPVLGNQSRPLRVAVVGSGPSAFYAVDALFKTPDLNVRVDVFDRLPTPFGLVRGGVAPDHQNIKSVVKVYERTAADPRFRFFGNVRIGRDLHVDDLTHLYDQIVWAVGNEIDRRMDVPGEDLDGVHAATDFVGWYNGHPDFRDRRFAVERAERAAVIGNGNVAMDVTRVLMKDAAELRDTDIADHALEVLQRSSVREVLLLGRRGPAQAAFSPKEIEEVADLSGCDLVVPPEEAALDDVSKQWLAGPAAPKSAHRNVKFLDEQATKGEGTHPRKVRCHFLVSPVEILGDDQGRVRAVRLQKAELFLDDTGTPRPRALDQFLELEVQLVFKAIGYRGVALPGVPFDERRGIIPNENGRVVDPATGFVVPCQYVVGWSKRGPTGLIGTNSPCSKATVEVMRNDLATCDAPALPANDERRIVELLQSRGIDFVSFEDWRRLDRWEQEQGQARGKVRHKLTSVPEMLQVIHSLRSDPRLRS